MELPIFYDQAEEWSRALLLYDAALKEINTKLEILNNEFKMAHQYNPIEHITSRIKSPESIAKKIRRLDRELTVENIIKYLNDVAGIRIICSFTSDIYRIANAIGNQSDVTILKIKDYIENPKQNGYMSYHMIVSIPIFLSNNVVNTKVEIQIRTIAMDFWASLEHKIYYKYEGKAPANIRNDLKECADLVAYLDKKMLGINEDIKKFSNEPQTDVNDFLPQSLQQSYGRIIEDDVIDDSYKEIKVDADHSIEPVGYNISKKAETNYADGKEKKEEAKNSTESVNTYFMGKLPFGKREKKANKSKKNQEMQYQKLS